MISLLKKRKKAYEEFSKIINDSSNVLLICYSYCNVNINQTDFSPIITSISIQSLDKNYENKYFSLIKEAEKANIELDDIEDNYEELEYFLLDEFNSFLKKHRDYIWIHWRMNQLDYGFEAIKHRFDITAKEVDRELENISANNKFDLNYLLETMYGAEYTKDNDKMKSLMKENNYIDLKSYMSSKQESEQFNEKQFSQVKNSINSKMNFMFTIIEKLENKTLKIPFKNNYSIFIEFISHPLFHLVGWLATILGTTYTFYS